jgi:ADP-ribose pyrophosphatase
MSDEPKTIFEGEHVLVLERDHWQYVERKKGKTAVIVLAITDDDRVLFVEQYRRPLDARVIEFPAGLVGDEEGHDDPAETAKLELEEETGFACEKVERLAGGPTSAGITSELVTYFRALGLSERGKGGGVGSEDITVHRIPRHEVIEWLKRKDDEGLLIDAKVWAGLWWLDRN